MPRVLLVEDDLSAREGVELGLRRRGHQVLATATGEAGLEALPAFRPDLLLLDLMLPAMSGVQVCRRVRESSQMPIIMLTARGDDVDIVVGLETGADDYIVKPARTEVIEARIRAVLRRVEVPAGAAVPAVEQHGELGIDRAGWTVLRSGAPVPLAPSELKLLLCLSAVPEQVFSRQRLLEEVWEHSYHSDVRLVDACVRRLRAKIEDDCASPRYVQTLRGLGYRFGPL
ncbi:response regulator [Streptomyces flavovirens]|uniref:response regulator transcription factor n=1 Tax=Streptomyces TaxID=1883 RepID=UPI00081B5AB6|nr:MULTISPECIES: response regulator transcription factor [unclassified Streptomyces]MYU31644.1 response regulator [Streptomyces sp. SID8358]MYX76439.1 response regulator [Streptomyces sp. SID3915]SCD63575.1 DNA-binding response regulator, OmpR family, contains REC and winged-helix (wHTH) domain [Streptomyces sp. BpilaLS-43]